MPANRNGSDPNRSSSKMNRCFQALLYLLLVWLLASCRTAPDGESEATASPSLTPSPAATVLLPTAEATVTATSPTPSPSPTEPAATATVPPATPVPEPDYPSYEGAAIDRSDVGLQIHLHREDQALILDQLRALDAGRVKVQVSWKIYQPEPDRFDDFRFEELDRFIEAANADDIEVLLSVAKAPEWSRPTTELDGPPADYAHFEAFMRTLAGRYQGRVGAYELWNEPNLQREWNGAPLNGSSVVELIRAGAAGVRAVDPDALIISGAPAPTGINDGLTAIDDRQFLRQMVAAGLGGVVDAVGVHPYGWANPPDSSAAAPDPAVPSHNNHPSFFYGDTLRDYRAILEGAGLGHLPLWATEFGWASYDGFGVPPPAGVEYMAAVDEQQQAAYTLRAYELARDWEWVGPLILWNLNFAPTFGTDFVESAYSALRPDGSPRPLYNSLTTITEGG